MAKPDFLGVKYAKLAKPVLDSWHQTAREGLPQQKKAAEAKLKSLKAMEARLVANPLSAGDTVQRDRWPRCIRKDYGEIPKADPV